MCALMLLSGGVGVVSADAGLLTSDSVEVAGIEVVDETEVANVALTPDVAPVAEAPDVPALIVAAARKWGVDERVLLRIAWCESKFDPLARGPAGLSGVFQFAPITWGWVAERAGHAGASPFDVRANVEAAAWLYKSEGPKHWGCK